MGLIAVLEGLIGLALIYFLVSLFCSSVNELLAQYVGRRGSFLREGLINIVGDRWMYLRVINHPLVAAMYRDVPGKPKTPSYIPATNFINALIEVVLLKSEQLPGSMDVALNPANGPRTFDVVRAAVVRCKEAGYPVGDALLPLLDAAGKNLDQAQLNMAAWYENAMDRVSGWYKRHTLRLLFLIGVATAICFNVDTLQIVAQLAQSAELRQSPAAAAQTIVETKRFNGVNLDANEGDVRIALADLQKLSAGIAEFETQGLPVGFTCLNPSRNSVSKDDNPKLLDLLRGCWRRAQRESGSYWLIKVTGWLITGLAVTLGAPFWFDLLNKLVDLRGAGRKPSTQSRAN